MPWGTSRSEGLFSTDYFFEVSKGNIAGHSVMSKFGYNLAVPTTETPIWSPNIALFWPSIAQPINLVSTDAGDDIDSGAGVQKVYIEGLDASWELQSETVEMEGLTPVQTAGSYRRFHRGWGVQVGTYHGANLGTIAFEWATDEEVAGEIPLGAGRTQQAHYTIPANKSAFLRHFRMHVAANKPTTMTVYVYENADDIVTPFSSTAVSRWSFNQVAGEIQYAVEVGEGILGPADVLVTGQAEAQTSEVIANYALVLVDEP